MRTTLLVGALLLATPVIAQTTVIEERNRPSTTVETRETTGTTVVKDRNMDCGSTTVSKENAAGDRKTVTKEGC